MSRTARRFGAWLALAAIALHASSPLAARAASAPAEHEICTAAGAKQFSGDVPARHHAAGMHCLLCPLGAERLPAIAARPADLSAEVAAAGGTPASLAAPVPRESPAAALSRAPPARS